MAVSTKWKDRPDDVRAEYNLAKLGPGGARQVPPESVGSNNLVLIEPDLMRVFPTGEAVNQALRMLAKTAGCSGAETRRSTG